MVLFDHGTLQQIKHKSGPLAAANEYQVHYWAVVVRATAQDNSILDICIPTVFFNYRQTVSGAHIDFELTDVEEASAVAKSLHLVQVEELSEYSELTDDIEALLATLGFTTTVFSTNLNSIHRHP